MHCDANVISDVILWRVKLVIALLETIGNGEWPTSQKCQNRIKDFTIFEAIFQSIS